MTLRQRAVVFKALGHRARLAVVERLALGECCVYELKELAELAGLSGPTVSQHLLVLKGAGVILDKKRGRRVFYRLLLPKAAGLSLQPREGKTKCKP
ncbi:MAG: metalloregulator ArsR/SmtB family transcription factor [Verrucomicrobiota bacterium]